MAFGVRYRCVCTIGDVQLDAEIRTPHTKTGTLTEHAVESGSPITDHYRVDPAEVEVEGVVTDSPTSSVPLPGFGLVEGVRAALEGGGQTPSETARDALEAYFDSAEIITIVTRRKTYERMVLTSFSYVDSAETANVLRFTVRARQIRLTDTATGVAIERPKSTTHAKKKGAGKGATKEVETEQERSIAKRGLDALAGAFQ